MIKLYCFLRVKYKYHIFKYQNSEPAGDGELRQLDPTWQTVQIESWAQWPEKHARYLCHHAQNHKRRNGEGTET